MRLRVRLRLRARLRVRLRVRVSGGRPERARATGEIYGRYRGDIDPSALVQRGQLGRDVGGGH